MGAPRRIDFMVSVLDAYPLLVTVCNARDFVHIGDAGNDGASPAK